MTHTISSPDQTARYWLFSLMETVLHGSNLGRLIPRTTDAVEACEDPDAVLNDFEAMDYSGTHGKAAKLATPLAVYHVRREIDIRRQEKG